MNHEVIVHLFRHGETESNLQKGYIHGRDPEAKLTKRGEVQMRHIGAATIGLSPRFQPNVLVYTSPLARAVRSSELATGQWMSPHPIEIVRDDRLTELSGGEWEGRALNDVNPAGVIAEMGARGADFAAPGGESPRQGAKRMRHWLDEQLTRLKHGGHVAAFSHSMAISCLIFDLMGGLGHTVHLTKLRVNNGEITRLRHVGKHWEIVGLNLTSI